MTPSVPSSVRSSSVTREEDLAVLLRRMDAADQVPIFATGLNRRYSRSWPSSGTR
jgi:hypothetical protein